jgi:hypothetical protein
MARPKNAPRKDAPRASTKRKPVKEASAKEGKAAKDGKDKAAKKRDTGWLRTMTIRKTMRQRAVLRCRKDGVDVPKYVTSAQAADKRADGDKKARKTRNNKQATQRRIAIDDYTKQDIKGFYSLPVTRVARLRVKLFNDPVSNAQFPVAKFTTDRDAKRVFQHALEVVAHRLFTAALILLQNDHDSTKDVPFEKGDKRDRAIEYNEGILNGDKTHGRKILMERHVRAAIRTEQVWAPQCQGGAMTNAAYLDVMKDNVGRKAQSLKAERREKHKHDPDHVYFGDKAIAKRKKETKERKEREAERAEAKKEERDEAKEERRREREKAKKKKAKESSKKASKKASRSVSSSPERPKKSKKDSKKSKKVSKKSKKDSSKKSKKDARKSKKDSGKKKDSKSKKSKKESSKSKKRARSDSEETSTDEEFAKKRKRRSSDESEDSESDSDKKSRKKK